MKNLIITGVFLILSVIIHAQNESLPFNYDENSGILPDWIINQKQAIADADECYDAEISYQKLESIRGFTIYKYDYTETGCEMFMLNSYLITVDKNNNFVSASGYEDYAAGEYSAIQNLKTHISGYCMVTEYEDVTYSYPYYDEETQSPIPMVITSGRYVRIQACISAQGDIDVSISEEEMVVSDNSEETELTEEQKITEIRDRFNAVSSIVNSLQVISKTDDFFQSVVGYFENSQCAKIVAVHTDNDKNTLTEEFYYFDTGRLCFMFETAVFDGVTSQNRYYFYNKELIKWLDPAKKRMDYNLYDSKGAEIYETSLNLLRLVRDN